MNECIFFSVIVPVYNAERYLKTAIESVLDQTYKKWELILINDGSQDMSSAICKKYGRLDRRIQVINQKNAGVSYARNQGIYKAKGNWIVFLDADDKLERSCLFKFKEKIEEEHADLIICNYYDTIDEMKRCERDITALYMASDSIRDVINASLRQSQWHGQQWYGNLRTVWGKCFNSKIIKDNDIFYDTRLKIGEDMVFVLHYMMNINSIAFMNIPLYYYRLNNNSIMHNREWTGPEQGILYFNIVEGLVKKNVPESAKADLWLETAETDWDTIHKMKATIKKKYCIFNELMKMELYDRFSKRKVYPYSSRKQKLYAFLIRHKHVLILMVLSYYRMNKHKYDVEKGLNL